MSLGHCRLGPIQNVGDKLIAIGQRLLAAIDIARLLVIYQKKLISASTPAEVAVLARLDESVRARLGMPSATKERLSRAATKSTYLYDIVVVCN
jgi:hypothetical protein